MLSALVIWAVTGKLVELNQAQHGGFALLVTICGSFLAAQTVEDRLATRNAARVGKALGLGPEQLLDVLEMAAAISQRGQIVQSERAHLPVLPRPEDRR